MWQIHQNSSAARAGVEPGDVIRSINEQPVDDVASFGRLISDAEIGSSVTVEILRYGQPVELQIVGERARPPQR